MFDMVLCVVEMVCNLFRNGVLLSSELESHHGHNGQTQVDPCTLVKIPAHAWATEPMGWKQGSLLGRGAFGSVTSPNRRGCVRVWFILYCDRVCHAPETLHCCPCLVRFVLQFRLCQFILYCDPACHTREPSWVPALIRSWMVY